MSEFLFTNKTYELKEIGDSLAVRLAVSGYKNPRPPQPAYYTILDNTVFDGGKFQVYTVPLISGLDFKVENFDLNNKATLTQRQKPIDENSKSGFGSFVAFQEKALIFELIDAGDNTNIGLQFQNTRLQSLEILPYKNV